MKYIIDIPDKQEILYDTELGMVKVKCCEGIIASEIYIDAEPYTEPDRKAIEDEVWKLARTIESMSAWEIMNIFDVREENVPFLCNTRTYQEAKSKFEAWLKDEIHVGDEVENASHKKGIVFNHYISPSNGVKWVRILLMDNDGNSFMSSWEENDVYKTGRHFDGVEELLKKMRGGEE